MLGATPIQTVCPIPGQIFPYYTHIGTMCNLSLGLWGGHLHTLSLFLLVFLKKTKMHVHICLKILVDLKNCDYFHC